MTDYSYKRNEAIDVINSIIDDINNACSTIGSSKLSISQRNILREMIKKIQSAIKNDASSGELYGMYNKLMSSLPKVVKDRINLMRTTEQSLSRIKLEPSIFEQCNKRLRESDIESEYDNIFRKKFNEFIIKKYGAEIAANFDKDVYEQVYDIWLVEQKRLFNFYANFLKANNLAPNQSKVHPVELFKGSYDSLKKFYPRKIEVFSRYASTIPTDAYTKGINSFDDITIRKGFPCYVLDTSDGKIHLPTKEEEYYTYYVHNPYDESEKRKIMRMLQNEDIDLTYGIFDYDKNGSVEKEIDELRRFQKEIEGAKLFTYEQQDGTEESFNMGLLYKPKKRRD